MAILKLQPGKPETISLRYKSPREVKSHSGAVEFQYNLLSGDILYLPPIGKSEIDSLSLAGSEPFTITKTIGQVPDDRRIQVSRTWPQAPEAR